jgi:DNA-binding MarR family transcriptional regulator
MPPIAGTTSSSEPLTALELDAWRGMLQVHAKVAQALDAEMQAEHGVSVSAYEVLMFLGDAPGHRLRMAEMAERVLLSRSGCTRLVDRLVKVGYVTRSAAEQDGRGLYAQLTDAGAEKLAAARRTHYQGVRRYFLDGLNVTDHLALADIWKRSLQHDSAIAKTART